MNARALEAAYRILTSTPAERIHRVERDWDAVEPAEVKRHPRSATVALHARIVALHMEGKMGVEIARIVEKSKTTVSKHLRGVIKATK